MDEKIKTGYEETNEKDTFQTIEEEVPEIVVKKDTKKAPAPPPPTEKKKGEEAEKEPEFVIDEQETPLPGEKKEKVKEEKKEGEEKEPEEEGEEEIFDTSKLEEEIKNREKVKKQAENTDWISVAKAIKVEGVEIAPKENTIEAFQNSIKEAVESAKTKTEFDLSAFDEEKQQVIKFLETGTVADLLRPLKDYDDSLLMPDEEKALNYLIYVKKLPKAEAQEQVEELASEENLDDIVKEANKFLFTNREAKYKQLLLDAEAKTNKLVNARIERVEKEKAEMISVIDNTKTFMGTKLPDNVKDYLKLEVKSGVISEKISSAETKIKARLFDMYGEKLLQNLKESSKEGSRKSFNDGQRKVKETLHNIPPIESTKTAVQTKVNEKGYANPLESLLDIGNDAIE